MTRAGTRTAILFAWHFLILCSYYLLRPARASLMLDGFGTAALPWMYMASAAATGAVVWIYTFFSHLPRRRLVGGTMLILLAALLLLGAALSAGRAWAAPALYVCTDIFSILSVTLFWMYADDAHSPEEANRCFGRLAAAGTLGGAAGASLAALAAGSLGVEALPLLAAAVYAPALLCLALLERPRGPAPSAEPVQALGPGRVAGLTSVVSSILASRDLVLLVAVVALERGAPDFVDFVFNSSLHDAFSDKESFASAFAAVDLCRSAISFLAAFFLASRVLKGLGVRWALASVPATIAVGAAVFAAFPVLAVAVSLKTLEEAQRHAWFKAGKELLYTGASRDVIYRVKPFAEIFLYRFARGAAGLAILFLTGVLGFGPGGVAAAAVPLAAAWGWAAWTLGRARSVRPLGGNVEAESRRSADPASVTALRLKTRL